MLFVLQVPLEARSEICRRNLKFCKSNIPKDKHKDVPGYAYHFIFVEVVINTITSVL